MTVVVDLLFLFSRPVPLPSVLEPIGNLEMEQGGNEVCVSVVGS